MSYLACKHKRILRTPYNLNILVDTGLWLVMAIAASGFTFFSLKTLGKTMMAFSMIAAGLWMGLAVIHAGGLEVSTTNTIQSAIDVNGTLTPILTNSTQVFIAQGTGATFLSWMFLGFAIFTTFNVARQVVKV